MINLRHVLLCAILVLSSFHSLPASADEGFLGIVLDQRKPDLVAVKGLASGASAQKAGVAPGDVIVSFNGSKITKSDELIKIIKATTPGERARSS